MQSTISSTVGIDRPTSAPLASLSNGLARASPLPFMLLASSNPASLPTFTRASTQGSETAPKPKGMQLGAGKVATSVAAAAASLAARLEEEAATEEGIDGNPWGTDDLINIDADEDDWSQWSHHTLFPSSGLMIFDYQVLSKARRWCQWS
jgi:SCY1-like protein 1